MVREGKEMGRRERERNGRKERRNFFLNVDSMVRTYYLGYVLKK